MPALKELALLLRGTVVLWARFFPVVAGWFCLAYGIRFATMQAAVMVGTSQVILGNLIFILGLVAWILGLVLMVSSLGPGLRFDRDLPSSSPLRNLYGVHSRSEVLLHGAAPFVALYAVGGFAEDQVNQLQQAALTVLNMDYHEYQLVRFDQWQLFLALAAGAWVVQQAAGFIHRRLPTLVTGLLQVAAKATVVLAVFIVVTELGGRMLEWLSTRAFVGWILDAWNGFIGWLPNWRLPFDLHLPEAVRALGEFIVFTALPGAVTVIVIPLAWLALTASVFGWRAMENNVIGLTLAERAALERAGHLRDTRAGKGVADAVAYGPLSVAWAGVKFVASDYLPVVQGVRLIMRAGARFVAAYLVAYALLSLLERVAQWGIWELVAWVPVDQHVLDQILLFISGMVITTLMIALYAKGFDRAILAAASTPGDDAGALSPAPSRPAQETPAR